ncbi:glycoside hydrolase/phage tail family protein [Aurantimonas sp. MSK8Z-1]|uniref:baseplate multidomain protein megatron n=1 Tax=Mangrovibrevibacter kandeliae TaxID=2968473 RepID=UPI002119A139|nr:glycoside hydrolase/phage tail family protein [Aurantimonas sp. MSK8Z-1]MCW4113871.1 glycoside hydrolase/phage tail family protein [Aurantimonas sp. MSK8Z-1]
MATIVLQAAGGLVGGLLGGPFGAVAGRALGALGGYALDSRLFTPTRKVDGARLGASRIIGADEGAGIARLYGTARIAGEIIWTTRFEEASDTDRQGGKGGGGGVEVNSYSYYGNVAIGLCEGPVAGIRRVWADGEELDLSRVTWRLHRGDDSQLPDPLIEAKQGAGNAPAYRGLAYIVFERLPLESWGNRIPQLSCEVIRPVGELEARLRSVTVIPGASEHGLDPKPVRERLGEGEDRLVNRNVLHGTSDWDASLDELQALCPKLERAALVVSWFGTDLRAGHCEIHPGVEVARRDESERWQVAGIARADARLVSRNDGGPAFGGSPSDAGVVRAIADLKARGLKVTMYPFILMDVPAGNGLPDPYGGLEQAAYPWRGRITLDRAPERGGSPDRTAAAGIAIDAFVGTAAVEDFALSGGRVVYSGPAEWSLRRMILHQAHLAKAAGGVDAFIVGSELRGLTRLRDETGAFPFVASLARLAADAKRVLPDAVITYAADWSEYSGFQPADGSGDVFFNLDPLWAHPAIGAIGIDNYLPLADWRESDWSDLGADGARSPYDRAALRRGLRGGEYYDWSYPDADARRAGARRPITDGAAGKPWVFRAKDLWNWWSNPHHERRGGVELATPTTYVPSGKPIWFTELGCPAVDKGPNQPNLFVDPKSAESGLPYFSSGGRDDLVQRRALETQLAVFDPDDPAFEEADNPISPVYGGRMVDPGTVHLWTWDARPFPAFPTRRDVWSDGDNWLRGHWLSGRLGQAPLDRLIRAMLTDRGFDDEVDVEAVDAQIGGFVTSGITTAREDLEDLLTLCGLVGLASDRRFVFRSLRGARSVSAREDLVDPDEAAPLELRRMQAGEIPQEVVLAYADPLRDHQPATASAALAFAETPRKETLELPVTLEEGEAGRLAAELLALRLATREHAAFALSPTAVEVEPGDLVRLPGVPGQWLVTRIESGASRRVEARQAPTGGRAGAGGEPLPASTGRRPVLASTPLVHLLDLPAVDGQPSEESARAAIFAKPWLPHVLQASASGSNFATRTIASRPATLGRLVQDLASGPEGRLDRGNVIEVAMTRGALFSQSHAALLAGGNLCALMSRGGIWEVLQFETAEEVAEGRFRLSGLLRAQGGTEDAMQSGAAKGAPLVLLDDAVAPMGLKAAEIGRDLSWRIVPTGRALDDPAVVTLTASLGGRAVRPLSPVHLRGRFTSDGGFTLGWTRRTRIGGDGWEGIDVPIGEDVERYAITLEGSDGRKLQRETTLPQLALTASEVGGLIDDGPAMIVAHVGQVSLAFGTGTIRSAAFRRED